VAPEKITDIGLMTVEGENDDISGIGQTQAAHGLCSGLPEGDEGGLCPAGVGHYGVFNGRRFREEIYPKVRGMIRKMEATFDKAAADKAAQDKPGEAA
jgi:poly(3-hydroxybutyrate) depolymerase